MVSRLRSTHIRKNSPFVEDFINAIRDKRNGIRPVVIINFDCVKRLIWIYVLDSRNIHRLTHQTNLTPMLDGSVLWSLGW